MKTDSYDVNHPEEFDEVALIIGASEYLGVSPKYLDIGTAVRVLRDADSADGEALNEMTGESIDVQM